MTCCAALAAPPTVTMTSTLSRTNSFAIAGETFAAPLRPAILYRDGAALDPAEFPQPAQKRRSSWSSPSACSRPGSRWSALCLLLRPRRQRPRCRRAAEQRDELAPLHSITSSARASSVGGTVEAERLGGLEIDDQFVLGRRLHRQVGRLLALEDAIDVAGGAPVLVDEIGPIGNQAAAGDEVAFEVDRGQLVPGRQRDDQIAMNCSPTRSPSRSGRHSERAAKAATARSISPASRTLTGLTSTLSDGATAWMAPNWARPEANGGIPKHRRARHVRRDLLEQLQPFPADAVFERHESSGVAARPRQALDEAGADRIDEDRETRSARCGSPAATAPTVEPPCASMTSGASATNSAACLRMASALAVAQRVSIRKLRPMVQPNCCRPCRNAPTRACTSASSAARA